MLSLQTFEAEIKPASLQRSQASVHSEDKNMIISRQQKAGSVNFFCKGPAREYVRLLWATCPCHIFFLPYLQLFNHFKTILGSLAICPCMGYHLPTSGIESATFLLLVFFYMILYRSFHSFSLFYPKKDFLCVNFLFYT